MTDARAVPRRSLRSRLFGALLPSMIALFIASGTASYYAARYYANQVHDRWLVDTAEALAQRVSGGQGRPSVDLPEAAMQILQWDAADATWFQVRGARSGHLAGHPQVPGPPPPDALQLRGASVYGGWINNQQVRVASVPVTLPQGAEPIEVRVAETLNKRRLLANELLLAVLVPQLVLVAVAGLVIWVTLKQLLAPVGAVAEALEAQTHHSLEPIDDRELPSEFAPLTLAMNELLLRLREALAAQRHFIADAAHQLRTPLTAVKLHADEAARETDPVKLRPLIGEVQRAAARAVRLSNQLLTLARAEPSARVTEPRRFELRTLAHETAARWVPVAIEAGIDLGIDGGPGDGPPVEVLGDADLLAEALNNLIDNALKYAGRGAHVTVSLDAPPDGAVRLVVDDDGPGIPPAQRERVFERFHRGEGETADVASHERAPGIGLGLPIVAEIVRGHGGTVRVEAGASGRGTRITLELPRAPAAVAAAPGTGRAGATTADPAPVA
jgi:two-component system sensor histidine kinase TctE